MPSQTSKPVATLDWTLVRSFLAVMDAGSFTAAAKLLGTHQPKVSRSIAELELQLGIALFERTGRGAVPTTRAMALVESARQMQRGADAMQQAAGGCGARTSGPLRIAVSMVASSYLLPPLLPALRDTLRGVQFEIVASNEPSNLLRREADIAVRMSRPTQTSLVARHVGNVHLGIFAHRDYLARAGRPDSAVDLLQHVLIGFDHDDRMLKGFASAGMQVERESFAVRTDDQAAHVELVRAGVGIGIIATHAAGRLTDVEQLLPELAIPPMACWLAVHREVRCNALVKRAYNALAHALASHLQTEAA